MSCGEKYELEVYVSNGWHKTCIEYCRDDKLCPKCSKINKEKGER